PLDIDTIYRSAEETGKLLVVDNGWLMCGTSAEIIAAVAEKNKNWVGIEMARLGFAPSPCPTSPWLEEHYYPNAGTIAAKAWSMAKPDAKPWTPSVEKTRLAYQTQFRGPF